MNLYTVEVFDQNVELDTTLLKMIGIYPSKVFARLWDEHKDGPSYIITFGQGFQALTFLNRYKDIAMTIKYGNQVVYDNVNEVNKDVK